MGHFKTCLVGTNFELSNLVILSAAITEGGKVYWCFSIKRSARKSLNSCGDMSRLSIFERNTSKPASMFCLFTCTAQNGAMGRIIYLLLIFLCLPPFSFVFMPLVQSLGKFRDHPSPLESLLAKLLLETSFFRSFGQILSLSNMICHSYSSPIIGSRSISHSSLITSQLNKFWKHNEWITLWTGITIPDSTWTNRWRKLLSARKDSVSTWVDCRYFWATVARLSICYVQLAICSLTNLIFSSAQSI